MSATTFAHQGIEAVQKKDYATAVPLLDKALASSNSPIWLLARAQAHQQLKDYEAALHDAELAYHVAAERGSGNSRKQMIEAQYRRSVLYYKLQRYADADCCAKWSMLLAEGRPAREDDGIQNQVDANGNYTVTYEQGVADRDGQPGQEGPKSASLLGLIGSEKTGSDTRTGFENDWKRAYTWRSQVLGIMKNLPEDHPGRKVNVTKIPVRPQGKAAGKKPASTPNAADDSDEEKASKPKAPAPGSVPDEQLKLRADFYQSAHSVTISLFGKDIRKDDLKIEFSQNQVQVSPLSRAAAPYVKAGDREATSTLTLGGEIDPSKSRWSATPRKIELVLHKAVPGVKWATWGSEEIGPAATGASHGAAPAAASIPTIDASTATPTSRSTTGVNTSLTTTSDAIPTPAIPLAPTSATGSAPAYPTSSRSGPKNWDKVVGGDGEEDDTDKQDVNFFFKQLYKGATPEQQRAMMKSFIESNGTALSTDWDDVKGRKVDTVPPEGVEAKKWEN